MMRLMRSAANPESLVTYVNRINAVRQDWNVVVVGAWSPRIFTPRCIKENLFQLTEASPIRVEIPIDAPDPPRVRNDDLVVWIDYPRLIVQTEPASYDGIARAAAVAKRAVEFFPKLNIASAGINCHFLVATPPDSLLEALETPIHARLAEDGRKVGSITLSHTINDAGNRVTITLATTPEEAVKIHVNVHRDATSPNAIAQLLAMTADDIKNVVQPIIAVATELEVHSEEATA
jgi:hypothetical protein